MRVRHGGMVLNLIGCLTFLSLSTSANPSLELTPRHILDTVNAFRTATCCKWSSTAEKAASLREDRDSKRKNKDSFLHR